MALVEDYWVEIRVSDRSTLASYLGYSSKVPLAQKVVELEEKIAQLQAEIKQLHVGCN